MTKNSFVAEVTFKYTSIPRLELAAAVLSTKMSAIIRKELQYEDLVEYYWTDSQVVLGYLRNTHKRFKVFVANRVQQIREHTVSQWNYVPSKMNPADCASRGLTGSNKNIYTFGLMVQNFCGSLNFDGQDKIQ